MANIDMIAFDADDTLWHNEPLYEEIQQRFQKLLLQYNDAETIDQHLFNKETGNLPSYGYGIKSFTLSMIETAVDLSGGAVSGAEIMKIIGFAHEMINHQTELLDDVERVVGELAGEHRLMIVTKGDLLDQEMKLARSGIGHYFDFFEVVSKKDADTMARLLLKYRISPQRFLMVGNSLKSDVLPVLELGGFGVHIPYHVTWAHETVHTQSHNDHERFFELEYIGQLPGLIAKLD